MLATNQLFKTSHPLFKREFPWEILDQIHTFLKNQNFKIEGNIQNGAILINPETISIGKNSTVEPGAYIKGPCIIGENCQIRHGAYIRGNLITENNVVIGHATEVKNSIFLNCSQAGHFAYVGDSILGEHVNLGAGTKCANLRLDRQNIRIEGQDTKRRKVGAFFGDHSQTGCNCVTNPGTIMLPHSTAMPCQTVKGIVHEAHRSAHTP